MNLRILQRKICAFVVILAVLALTAVFALPVQAVIKVRKPVENLPFIFTAGTHGTLVLDDLPVSGNVARLAEHLHENDYVLRTLDIPQVQADADWLFRGWRVYLVKETEGQFAYLTGETVKSVTFRQPLTTTSTKSDLSGDDSSKMRPAMPMLSPIASVAVDQTQNETAGSDTKDKSDPTKESAGTSSASTLAKTEENADPSTVEDGEESTSDEEVTSTEEKKELSFSELIEEVEIITRQNMNEALAKYLDTPNPDIVYSSDVLQFLKLPYRKGYVYLASPYYQYIPKTPRSLLIRHQLDSHIQAEHLMPIPATGEAIKRVPANRIWQMALLLGTLYGFVRLIFWCWRQNLFSSVKG